MGKYEDAEGALGTYQDAQRLSVDALVRSLAVNQGRPVCLLLGAGASISSGMPSAQRCIWEWKQDIFVTRNPTLRESVGELSLPGTRRRIQRWLDQEQVYPAENSGDEYSFFAKACYPTATDRRSYFQRYVAQSSPHVGYRLLAQLAKAGLVRTVWTTNFDGLVARACAAADVVAIEVGIDTAHRAVRQHQDGELRVVSLHGDFRYDQLKNTTEELQLQESALEEELLHELRDHDLVVIGYSGRDVSLMSVLTRAFQERQASRLYWCGFGEVLPEPVSKLMAAATLAGRSAFYVSTEGFDDLLSRASLRLLDGEHLQKAKTVLASNTQPTSLHFKLPESAVSALIKSNAYLLAHPTQALQLDISVPVGVDQREWLQEQLAGTSVVTVAMNGHHLALGDPKEIQERLGNFLRQLPLTVELSSEEVVKDGRIRSLFGRATVLALARQLSVETDGGRRIWEPKPYERRFLNDVSYTMHKALAIRPIVLGNKLNVALMPEVVPKLPSGELADRDSSKVLRNAVYGYQHNNVFDTDLTHWTKSVTQVDLNAGGGAVFRISKAPIYAGLTIAGTRPLHPGLGKFAKQSGTVLDDARLVFSSNAGATEVSDINPLKGLVRNRPWDFGLTASGLSPLVEVAVVCPRGEAGKMGRFLTQFQERAQPLRTEQDYLHEFPGFSAAFGLPLMHPNPGEPTWLDLDDVVSGDALVAAKQLAQRICRALDLLRALSPAAVAMVFVPSRWEPYKVAQTETEQFNLHDYVKAYAARQGQSTQFVREETTATSQMCRVRWWLSLALYAKALRTPWRLDCLDDDTAFVGIGYSIDAGANPGSHVLLGCSHLYSARGEGLQFRLGRVDNPIMRGRNPFMSEDDARRTGETIRQLFFDAKMRLPRRVVVHKRTPFTKDEKAGLIQGLEGVSNVELIEVNIEESLRYLASKLENGRPVIDSFPVPRGALVVLNQNTALLWVHGSAPNAINPKWRYYQGKRRIPAPLLIRRHLGQSDVSQVATEILGLSKMNWNTFDYYSRLPATLDSASAIAKVGTYLGSFSAAPYDYRLLI